MTPAEKLLWERLRNRQLGGVKFWRQCPLGAFIADFYRPERRLIIEVDGDIHLGQAEADEQRDLRFAAYGYRVMRVRNSERPPSPMTLILVRHAHADWSADENRPLSPRGLRDAGQLGGLLSPHPIARIVSSPARRAAQTIAPLARLKHLPIEYDARLRERELGDCADATFEEAVRRTWEDLDFAHPNGETNRQAQRRAVQALAEASPPAALLLVSTHGNLLALILQHYLPSLGFEFWRGLTMPDAYRLEITPDGEAQLTRLWPG